MKAEPTPYVPKATSDAELYLKAVLTGLFLILFFFPAARPWNWGATEATPVKSIPPKAASTPESEATAKAERWVYNNMENRAKTTFKTKSFKAGPGWVVRFDFNDGRVWVVTVSDAAGEVVNVEDTTNGKNLYHKG